MTLETPTRNGARTADDCLALDDIGNGELCTFAFGHSGRHSWKPEAIPTFAVLADVSAVGATFSARGAELKVVLICAIDDESSQLLKLTGKQVAAVIQMIPDAQQPLPGMESTAVVDPLTAVLAAARRVIAPTADGTTPEVRRKR